MAKRVKFRWKQGLLPFLSSLSLWMAFKLPRFGQARSALCPGNVVSFMAHRDLFNDDMLEELEDSKWLDGEASELAGKLESSLTKNASNLSSGMASMTLDDTVGSQDSDEASSNKPNLGAQVSSTKTAQSSTGLTPLSIFSQLLDLTQIAPLLSV